MVQVGIAIYLKLSKPYPASAMAGVVVGIYSEKHTGEFTRESSLSLSSLLIFNFSLLFVFNSLKIIFRALRTDH